MKKMLTLILIMSLLVLGACSQNTSNKAKDGSKSKSAAKVMRLAVATPDERSLTKGLRKFGEIIEKKTNGSIKVEVFPNGQLGGDREVFEGLQLGSIQGSTISTGPVAQFAPRFNVFDFPYLFPDAKTAYEILDGPIGTELLKDLDSQNVVGLNYWENGFRHLTNNKKEIKSVSDVKGLKIRTLENDLHIDYWKQLGANPTPMAFTELFAGLQQGVVDGQENPAGNVTTSKFYEVQKYITKTGHVYNASLFMVSKKFWDSLSDKEKEAVQQAADEARDYQRELNQQEDVDAFKLLAEKGMVITELSDAEKEKFFEAAKPVYDKYSTKIGKEFVDKLLAEIQKKK